MASKFLQKNSKQTSKQKIKLAGKNQTFFANPLE